MEPSGGERPSLSDTASAFTPYLVVVGVAVLMWFLEIVDTFLGGDLDEWGIEPRQVDGLWGIAFAPFLHADFAHLVGNTIPFLVLGWIIAAGGVQRYLQVTIIVAVVAGLGTWLIGPSNSIHIGASSLVFGYLGYLVARGVFERRIGHVLIALAVLFFYGSILWGLLPRPGISWQGHLFGLVGGVVAAWVIHGRGASEPAAAV